MQAPPELLGTRVLLVDNYSSFSQNLVHYIAEVTGLRPLVVRNDVAEIPDLSGIHAVVLSPGPGSPTKPADFGICTQLLEQSAVPVLGICLGHQGLGVVEGATLTLADEPFHGRLSTIEHGDDALFDNIPSRFTATRYHSLILRDPLPESLRCIARTESGDIMALRHTSRPHWSVQFHPESIASEFGHELLANFCRLARHHRTAPTTPVPLETAPVTSHVQRTSWQAFSRTLESTCDVDEAFERLYSDSETAFWLDGSAGKNCSYFGDAAGPHAYRISYDVNRQEVSYGAGRTGKARCESIFAHLEELLAGVGTPIGLPPEFAFTGGFVGYFGYELKRELGAENRHASSWPDAEWIWADRFVAYNHANASLTLVALCPSNADPRDCKTWLDATEDALLRAPIPRETFSWPAPSLQWRDTPQAYAASIQGCLHKITQGESYELCLTTQLEGRAEVNALALFRRMRHTNPAPYSAFLRCSGFSIASASPERFLRIDAMGLAESKPIKGTARRDADPTKDRALAEALANSEKERAENLMIVDLVRHDLGHSCEVGSVRVTASNAIESYSSVHQLVSTVQGQLRSDVSPLQCVAAAFPGGSMTGAPKTRSMEILDELESGPRGPYAGSIGFLSTSGAVDLSIVIRSVVVEPGKVHLGVGGAITALSDVDAEVAEVSLKAKAQLEALQDEP